MWWVWDIYWVWFCSFLIISTDVTALVEEIQKREPLITASCLEHIIHLVQRLQEKLGEKQNHKFSLFKVRGILKIILGICGGLSCDTMNMFLLLCLVLYDWMTDSLALFNPLCNFRATESGLIFLPGIPLIKLRGITVRRHCLARFNH